MAGSVDASRDLRLGLYAFESGAIDHDQLVSAVRAWARSPGRPLSQILAARRVLDSAALARLEDQVTSDLSAPGAPDSTVTFAHAPRGPGIPGHTAPPTSEGRFRVVRPHARGGLGEVFLAFDGELNRPVALKELQARRAHDPDSQARFLLEAEVTGRLEHPGIVPVYSLGRYPDGRPYYAMRLIEGETLRAAIERFHRTGTSPRGDDDRELAFRRLLRSVVDACNAVAYAHSRGVVHRDLKPDNIMLGPFGETIVVDWGVAKSLAEPQSAPDAPRTLASGDTSMTQPGSVIGTPRYMSPEQAAGALDRVGPASDIYSLGAILYTVLVGHDPFPEGTLETVLDHVRRGIFPAPRRVRRSVDPTLEAVCLKAMSLNPADRHASALDLAHDLDAWQADVRYRDEQETAVSQMQGSLARLSLERAHACFAREERPEGMLWLSRALENAPASPPELPRLIRTSLCAWHSGTKLLERSLRLTGEAQALAFSPEGRRLVTAGGDRTARLWDLSTGVALSPPLPHGGAVRAVAFHPDGASIATACDDGTIHRWNALTGTPVGPALRLDAPASSFAFSPDGTRLAVTGVPLRSFLWDVATLLPLNPPGAEPGPRVLAAAFSPDGSSLAASCDDGAVRLLSAATGEPLAPPFGEGASATALAFDPTGRRLLTGGPDGSARLWDLEPRSAALTLPHVGPVLRVAFRPDGAAFATACDDGTARLWDASSGLPIGEPLAHRARVDGLAFRPDGTSVATGSPDGTARLWCAATGLPIGPPLAHGGAVRALAFSPDGRRLATGGSDASVRCWEIPHPVDGTPERISCWVRVSTDLDFDPGDAIRRLDLSTSWDLRRRLSDLGGPPLR